MNRFSLEGKKAIVTGAGRGIGHAITEALLEVGATVAMIDIDPNIAETAATMPGVAYGAACNLLDRSERKKAFDDALAQLGGLDILVNNVGMQIKGKLLDYEEEDWDRILELNLTCAFSMTKYAGAYMKKKHYGKILNLASMNSYLGGTDCVAYAASKAGIVQLTKAAANELSKYRINVNAIAPGFFETELTKSLTKDKQVYEYKRERIPADRWGTLEDIKGPAIFLCSPASDYVCGVTIPVDGGYLCK